MDKLLLGLTLLVSVSSFALEQDSFEARIMGGEVKALQGRETFFSTTKHLLDTFFNKKEVLVDTDSFEFDVLQGGAVSRKVTVKGVVNCSVEEVVYSYHAIHITCGDNQRRSFDYDAKVKKWSPY